MKTNDINVELIRVVEDLKAKRIIKKDVDISLKTGFSQAVISNYLSGRVAASKNFLKSFQEVFNVKINILERNNNKTYPLNKGKSNSINEDSKDYIKQRRDKKLNDANTLTYYDISANAGTLLGGEILPVNKNEGVLHISDLFKGSQYAIRISGNSMMPNYPPGAIIGIREITDKQIVPGSVYVIQRESDLWIKRLFFKSDDQDNGIVECISDNTMKFESGAREGKAAYPPFYVASDSIIKLFKVTGIYKSNELTVIN